MAMAFTRISHWIWGRKGHNTPNLSSSSSSDFPSGFREPEHLKFPQAPRVTSSSRRPWRKWKRREEPRVDKEYDIVLVPSDGDCMSGSDSDGSDWSIGWSEPHDPEFQNSSEVENSFAVLVPCYRRNHADNHAEGSKSPLGLVRSNNYALDDKKRVEGWLSSF